MDVVWLLLFGVLYLWGNAGGSPTDLALAESTAGFSFYADPSLHQSAPTNV